MDAQVSRRATRRGQIVKRHSTPEYREYQRQWRRRNAAKVKGYSVKWRENNLDKARKTQRDSKKKNRVWEKQVCIAAYGGKCACCEESNIGFLTMDHINGQGARHRKRLGMDKAGTKTGADFYRWLREQGYPKDEYQALCYNCNCGRQINGGVCPHVSALC